MTNDDIKKAIGRILKGERALLLVKPENEAAAREMLLKLSPRLQALLTIEVSK